MDAKWIADEDELPVVPQWLREIITMPLSDEEVAWLDEQARLARASGKTVIGWPERDQPARIVSHEKDAD